MKVSPHVQDSSGNMAFCPASSSSASLIQVCSFLAPNLFSHQSTPSLLSGLLEVGLSIKFVIPTQQAL